VDGRSRSLKSLSQPFAFFLPISFRIIKGQSPQNSIPPVPVTVAVTAFHAFFRSDLHLKGF
jgi:hypothetical protein